MILTDLYSGSFWLPTKAKEHSLTDYLPIAGGRKIGFISFRRILVLCEIQTATRVGISTTPQASPFYCNIFLKFLLYIYIYIYIYICSNFIKHNRHFMSTYFLLDPFEFPYYFYRILGKLIYVLSIVACIPSTFCPTLGHHQGRIYYKSDVTFVLANYYCVRAIVLGIHTTMDNA